ncbi:reverse transcriptase domain-containing protein [Paraburkholderia xenovorans]|uniref:reverse transcriptase domain-containing protein n=1 Tax=Paraburkholderia xenovorans TaxID=36873 RepID=UPI0018F75071|nr:reverse transcriptase domain-containing protein [Paraburkholderia xenovorans]
MRPLRPVLIADRRTIRLIRKWLKAGTIEEGRRVASMRGTPQSSVISPLLANVYMHYALSLWAQQWRNRHAAGDVIIVRYADDSVLGFQCEGEARRFLRALQERMAHFGLQLHPDKNAVDSLRAICHAAVSGARHAQAGDLRLSGVHALLQYAAQ